MQERPYCLHCNINSVAAATISNTCTSHLSFCLPRVKVARICAHRNARLLFRGWSRICMHAASLNATEAVMASATAAARATRTEAMEKEAEAAAEKAEASKRVAAASTELAAAREQARRETAANVSTTAAELKQRQAEWEEMVREQQERRVKMLVRPKFNGDRRVRPIVTVEKTDPLNPGSHRISDALHCMLTLRYTCTRFHRPRTDHPHVR